jgi:hypothetical protein
MRPASDWRIRNSFEGRYPMAYFFWSRARRIGSLLVLFLALNEAFTDVQAADPTAQTPDSKTPMCMNIKLGRQLPCTDIELFFREGEMPVQTAFQSRKFADLDDLYKRWCTGRDRFADGRWKLTQYEAGFKGWFSAWNRWDLDLQAIQAWQKERAGSEAAWVAEAVYWQSYAWRARGTGYADTVSQDAWELFKERLNKSKAILSRIHSSNSSCPAPYAMTITVLLELGAPRKLIQAVYEEGAKRFPQYHGIYFAMARTYEPKWGGSAEEYEKFANDAARATKDFEGGAMYSRIYWLVDNNQGIPFRAESPAPPRWQSLKAGYQDLMRLYPASMNNLTKFTDVTCRSHDSELYRTLRSRIVGNEDAVFIVDSIDVCDRRHHWAPAAATHNP